MDEVQGDDGYSDDDLDALPAETFHELQETAIRSTQNPRGHGKASVQSKHRPLTKSPADLTREIGGLSFEGLASQQGRATPHPEPPSSDYGDFNDEMLDGEIYDAAEQPAVPVSRSNPSLGKVAGDSTQREEWRQQRFGGLPQSRGYEEQLRPHKSPGNLGVQNHVGDKSGSYKGHPPAEMLVSQSGEDVESLQAQIQEVCLFPEPSIHVYSDVVHSYSASERLFNESLNLLMPMLRPKQARLQSSARTKPSWKRTPRGGWPRCRQCMRKRQHGGR